MFAGFVLGVVIAEERVAVGSGLEPPVGAMMDVVVVDVDRPLRPATEEALEARALVKGACSAEALTAAGAQVALVSASIAVGVAEVAEGGASTVNAGSCALDDGEELGDGQANDAQQEGADSKNNVGCQKKHKEQGAEGVGAGRLLGQALGIATGRCAGGRCGRHAQWRSGREGHAEELSGTRCSTRCSEAALRHEDGPEQGGESAATALQVQGGRWW